LEWTADRIAELTVDQVKVLRDNAAKSKALRTVDLCDADLARRNPRRTQRLKAGKQARFGGVVHGFHFVCPDEKGITRNPDGTVWTGTWVVDKIHAERAIKVGGYVALHVTKSEPSYLQGVVRHWRTHKREPAYAEGQLVKTQFGVDFLIELTDQPVQWHGDGSGEKGYFYGEPSLSDAGVREER
jgi:hypothetical protein